MQSLQRLFGYGSPSPERDPVTGRIIQRRAKSPPLLTQEQIRQRTLQAEEEYSARQQASLRVEASKFMYNYEVNEFIRSINEYLTSFFGESIVVNVDDEDPNIRFIVGTIVASNNVRISAAQKLKKSRLLLKAVANVIINIAKRTGIELSVWLPIIQSGLKNVGRFLLKLSSTAGRTALNTASLAASAAASSFRSFASRPRQEVAGRAASPPPQRMYNIASAAYESVAEGLPGFYNALSLVLERVYELLSPCVSSTARRVIALAKRGFTSVCAYLTPQQAVEQAVSEVVNQATPLKQEEEESICAICMENEQENPEQLGYVIAHSSNNEGHPNRFHMSCLRGCPGNKCPMCREAGPVWGMQRRQRQGGGGLRKYRSKSKSKSNSRRYISKPQKSRKARKRVRHASSRRK
jgi:hypothetical protein